MYNSLKNAMKLMFLGAFFSMLQAATVVLQNGLDGYTGTADAHMTHLRGNANTDPSGADEALVFQE